MRNKFIIVTLKCISIIFILYTNVQAQLPEGLAAYYKFDNNINDDSGNGNHGSVYGGTWINGKVGTALSLDGIDDHVIVPDSPSLNPALISIGTWIKLTAPAPAWGAAIVEKDGWNGGQTGYAFLVGNWGKDNTLLFEVYSPHRNILSNKTLLLNEWYHVVATYDGTVMKIYINGELDNASITSGNLNVGNDGILGMGARFINSGVNWDEIMQTIQGALDEAAIYNRALTQEEIVNQYQNGLNGYGLGDACNNDMDCDGVSDPADICQFTAIGEVVDPATGCSISQLCPCVAPLGTTTAWRNHGQYVSCVAKSSENFVLQGVMTETQKDPLVSQAANSVCGSNK